uniref:Uncharacterized protein n=1 Tax=Solibacter usitatus (strain Ellin6076) TaxID=234267 RepID=Q01ZA7_SOLUE
MRRFGLLVTAIVIANLAWVWLQRHDSAARMARRNDAPQQGDGPPNRSTSVKITQFYATSGEITDADHDTVCYGVENARSLRLEPPVADVRPALTRCFWVEPKQDTTYSLTAEGSDGSTDFSSFRVRVKPAPPSILFMAVSKKEIVRGDAVTVCYGVEHAKGVRLEPIGWNLFAGKKECVRIYPPRDMKFTLIAAGISGATARNHFDVKVR